METNRLSADRHTRRFGIVGLVIAGGELTARIIGADPGRDDPVLVLGLVALTVAAVMILRDDDRGRTAWILSGVVMTLYAVARVLIIGRFWQTAALAALGVMLALAAEQTLRPVEGTRRGLTGARIARSALFDYALIPLAVFALFPFGVSLSPQGALATAAREEGYPVSVQRVVDHMAGIDSRTYYYKLPNECTVSALRTGKFWHPGSVYCGSRGGGGGHPNE